MKRNSKQRLHGTIGKRRKVPKDPLSNLPADVFSQILSRLPINDAVRTSVLSRKWKRIWRGHTNLTFSWDTMRKHYFNTGTGYTSLSDTEFIKRVDAVLHQHSGRGIEHMEINFGLHKKHADHIDRWVDFAIAAKTKKLTINLLRGSNASLSRKLLYGTLIYRPREELYNIPSQVFDGGMGSYLQCLELTCVDLQLPADFKGFMKLKNLTLVDVSIRDEGVQCMLSRCSLLESFKISYCRMVTSIQVSNPLSQLKHLLVDRCPLLQVIELNCSPITLEYTGNMVLLNFASTLRLTNVRIKFLCYLAALDYIVTGFPASLPSLETMTFQCCALRKKNILPERPFIFTHLRYLKLELVLHGKKNKRKTDVLDYAYLLEAAPFMEKLELHMWMDCRRQPYCKEDGKLRIRLPQQHTHLKFVRISGFFGHKDQVELALHILRSSVVLEKMEITPRIEIAECDDSTKQLYERIAYVDGLRVATEFVCKADPRNVVDAVKASFTRSPPINYGHWRGGDSQRRGWLSRQHRSCRRRCLET